MMISMIRLIGALGAVMVTTAAMCNSDGSASASTNGAANVTSAAPSAPNVAANGGPGLPADFPIAPGLSPCKPHNASGEIICEWHNVDEHAMFTFYRDALPKAGYTLLHGAQEAPGPHYMGGMGFKKGSAKGAVTIAGGTLTIQYLAHE